MTRRTGSPPPYERRSGTDRRKVDRGPPDGRERRVTLEPRKPIVMEIEMSASEWARLNEQVTIEPPKQDKKPRGGGPAA